MGCSDYKTRWNAKLSAIATTFLLTACGGSDDPVVSVISQPTQAGSYFDAHFPADDLIGADGTPDLEGFPTAPHLLSEPVVSWWISELSRLSAGFGLMTASYFRFDGPLTPPATTLGLISDPMIIIDSATSELFPLDVRFTEDPLGDPFVAENSLAFAPVLGATPESGATLYSVVFESVGAVAAADYEPSAELLQLLESAGITSQPIASTKFTTRDLTSELAQLFEASDDTIESRGESPFGDVTVRRVVELAYDQGFTGSGEPATVATTTFESGEQEVVFLHENEGDSAHTVDLGADWPMAVFQIELMTTNFSGLDDRPYMSPGLSHLLDVGRESGVIPFADGQLIGEPEDEVMRVVVSLPKDGSDEIIEGSPLVMWDHGTGGHAYNHIQRPAAADLGPALNAEFASAGWGIIARDSALYGARFDLVDQGFSDGSLGFYNIVHLPVFGDNLRQTAIDGHLLTRFVSSGALADSLGIAIDQQRLRRLGHSMGSVTTNLGLAVDHDLFESSFLSGSGGGYFHYFMDTGLLDEIDPETISSILSLFGANPSGELTATSLLGAVLGIPESAWDNIDRLHPVATIVQWALETGDPMATARYQASPSTIIMGIGDYQVPNNTTIALDNRLPDSEIIECNARSDYDPHLCLFREPEGLEAINHWLNE